MDELACFVPGMLALGSFGYDPVKQDKFFTLAKEVPYLQLILDLSECSLFNIDHYNPNSLWSCFTLLKNDLISQLAWTCYNFYQSTPTKLAGENYYFHDGQVRFLWLS